MEASDGAVKTTHKESMPTAQDKTISTEEINASKFEQAEIDDNFSF